MAEYETHVFSDLHENIQKIVLENITSVTLNTEVLKINFEAIVSILKGLTKKVDQGSSNMSQTNKDMKELREKLEKLEDKQKHDKEELNEKISNNQELIKDVLSETKENTQDIKDLKDSLKELKDNQNDLKNLCHNDLNAIKEKLEKHDRQIEELLQRITGGSNRGGDNVSNASVESLKHDMNDMKKNFDKQIAELHKLLEDYVKKDEFNGYKDQTDNKLQSHQDSIDDLYSQLRDVKTLLSDKLNCETFDEHLADYNNIKNIVIGLANNSGDGKNAIQQIVQAGPSLSTKDANLLKELGQKFPELEAIVKKLQKDFTDHVHNYKSFSEDTSKKIQNSEENLKNFKVEINKKIAEIEATLKSLREQILVGLSGSSGKGSGESSADLKKLQLALLALTDRVSNIEKDVNNLGETTDGHRIKIGNIEDELNELRALKARLETLELLLREIREKDHRSKGSKGSSFDVSSSGVTLDQVRQIVDEEIRKLRDEILAMLDAFHHDLEKKADTDDLLKSEAALLEKLDQIAGALMKRAQADKNDTKKALMFLEKKINEISLIVLGGPSNNEEGAIFAKKPWTPWSCASCDSKLKDYPGALIDHKNWNKLPNREATSPGRLTQGKFGKGWSKWVDNKRTTIEKTRDPFFSPSKLGDALPEINREAGRSQMDSERND
jgi:DNA repair exonuclease SbcCD ATPase subunit